MNFSLYSINLLISSFENSNKNSNDFSGMMLLEAISGYGSHIQDVISNYSETSFDSRYFGAIKKSLVQGKIRPVLTW